MAFSVTNDRSLQSQVSRVYFHMHRGLRVRLSNHQVNLGNDPIYLRARFPWYTYQHRFYHNKMSVLGGKWFYITFQEVSKFQRNFIAANANEWCSLVVYCGSPNDMIKGIWNLQLGSTEFKFWPQNLLPI